MRALVCVCILAAVLVVRATNGPHRREPQWAAQWHLHDTSERDEYWMRVGSAVDHLAVQTVWTELNFTGRGVRIAVVDDGVDVGHAEFTGAWDAALAYDFNDNDADPTPSAFDVHGTESASVATAHVNGICGVGTAPESILVPIRLIAAPVSDLTESDALAFHADVIDVYSNSWGPPDDGAHLDAPGPLAAAAMYSAVTHGRGGRGSVYVWAAGNGRQWLDSCSYDGFANSRLVMAVAAVDYFGKATFYGEWCPTVLVSAPSSSASGPENKQRIATAQPRGRLGGADCASDFGGTSAAAPMIAGVVALLLEARPALGWRDVQHVLALSARRNDVAHTSWMQNGAGHWVSHAYGFGVANATAAALLASTWTLLPAERYVSTITPDSTYDTIADGVLAPAHVVEFVVDDDGIVEFVDLYLTVEHDRRGDLEVLLYSPSGLRNELALPHDDNSPHYDRWRFGSRMVLGETARGTWRLTIRDAVPNGKHGVLEEAELRVWVH